MARVRGNQTCIVCGHNLGPYGRICDKCGSIQRPVRGDGLPLPPDKYKPCERCGLLIPIESQADICADCAATDEPRQVLWLDEDEEPHKKARLAAKFSTGVTSAATLAAVLSVVFVGAQVALIVFLAVATMALGASVASWMIISRRPAHKIEYYPPIKPDGQGPVQQS